MASLLRQIVAGPRARHPEAGLDLCYVTDNIVATSGPSQTYPQLAYRNPLDQLVNFLDSKHGQDWAIWEFRAEGTGYPDDAVYNRIRHYPWPDHHPPPFRLIPLIMASMRNWLHGGGLDDTHPRSPADGKGLAEDKALREERRKKRVVVVHCKAGKGRSGTASCSYLIAEEGWKPEDALARFTERRMRPKFGAGVTIPSQLRWISYVDRWTRNGKKYIDRSIEIVEIHVWGLRSGVKINIEGFADEGKRIQVLHTFQKSERIIIDSTEPEEGSLSDLIWEMAGYTVSKVKTSPEDADLAKITNPPGKGTSTETAGDDQGTSKLSKTMGRATSIKKRGTDLLHRVSVSAPKQHPDEKSKAKAANKDSASSSKSDVNGESDPEPGGMAVILKPTEPVQIPNSDVNIAVERRNKTHKSMGLTMVTAVAHVWFNTFFEGQGPEQHGKPLNSGIFGIEWNAMDGIKGSSRKGTRAFDRMAVVWRTAGTSGEEIEDQIERGEIVVEPGEDEPVPQTTAANWQGTGQIGSGYLERDLGLRVQSPDSAGVSKASSIMTMDDNGAKRKDLVNDDKAMEGVKTSGPSGEELPPSPHKRK
ncbi:hypothetical protein BGZ63DRAFT_379067 [Mariannaea sp. PMI_226]|nr:hypothetical protein BGZ63DRAFT_379067 [Mariannaea sp. PMI_226]